jgi:hypothetical protein
MFGQDFAFAQLNEAFRDRDVDVVIARCRTSQRGERGSILGRSACELRGCGGIGPERFFVAASGEQKRARDHGQ